MNQPKSDTEDIQTLLQLTREQTRVETQRIKIESEKLEEEKRLRKEEERRNILLQEMSSKLDLITKLIVERFFPELHNIDERTKIQNEILRLIASSTIEMNQDRGVQKQLQDLLLKLAQIKENNGSVIVHNGNLSSERDVVISAEHDITMG